MGIFSDLFDGGYASSKKKNEANSAALQSLLGQQYGFGISKLLEGLSTIDASYLNQKGSIASVGDTAANQILELGQQTLANTNQGLVDAGLSSTTVAGNAAAQVAKGTNQSLSSLAEQIGTLNAGIDNDYAKTKFGALSNVANFAMNKVGVASSITPQYQASGGGLAGALGALVGDFAGPLLGGAAGGLTSLFSKSAAAPQKPKQVF